MRSNGNLAARRVAAGLLTAAFAFGLVACGDDGDDDAATDTTAADDAGSGATDTTAADDGGSGDAEGGLTISDFSFSEASVAAGGTLAVTNDDSAPHTVTPDEEGAFEELRVDAGSSGEITAPSEPGEYPFHCEIHRSMTGTLVVE